jgi:hypothetical protein
VRRQSPKKNLKQIEVSSAPSEGVAVIPLLLGRTTQVMPETKLQTLRISDPKSTKTWSGEALKIH